MFEKADKAFAQQLVVQLEKPLKDVDPRFLLEKFEGHRSINVRFRQGRGHLLHACACALVFA